MGESTSSDGKKPQRAFPRWAAIAPVAILAIITIFFGFGLTRDPHALPSALIDRPTPEFELAPLADDLPKLRFQDIPGGVSLVNVWGTWCAVCIEEHPQLMAISQENTIRLYGVDWRDAPGDGAVWLTKHGNPFSKTGLDADSRLAIALGVTGAPESFLIDAEGRIRYKHVGQITPEVWKDTLKPMIQKLEEERK